MIRLTPHFWRRRRFNWYSGQTTEDRRRRILQLLLLLLALAAANSLAMVAFEGLSLPDAVWLTLTTITTVGYGDFSAVSVMGRLVTILLLFFLGIFLIKYRVEFLLTFPLFALLFVWYLHLGMKEDSVAQRPEKMYQERGFVAYVMFLGAVVTALFFIDIPGIHWMTEVTRY